MFRQLLLLQQPHLARGYFANVHCDVRCGPKLPLLRQLYQDRRGIPRPRKLYLPRLSLDPHRDPRTANPRLWPLLFQLVRTFAY